MRAFPRIGVSAMLLALMAGCAGPANRRAILDELDPEPMTQHAWSQVTGSYTGPVRASTLRGGFEGLDAMEIRLDLSGSADEPAVVMRSDTGFSTAWAMYGERKGTFTNIPSRRYGTQGSIIASTHAPDQLFLQARRNGIAGNTSSWMILTFRGNGIVDVRFVGHAGYTGEGELWRVPPPRPLQ